MYGPDCMGQILDIKHGYHPKIVTSVSRPGKDRQTAKKEIKDTPGISWYLLVSPGYLFDACARSAGLPRKASKKTNITVGRVNAHKPIA